MAVGLWVGLSLLCALIGLQTANNAAFLYELYSIYR